MSRKEVIRYGGRWTSKDVQSGEMSGKGRTEDEREAEVEQNWPEPK